MDLAKAVGGDAGEQWLRIGNRRLSASVAKLPKEAGRAVSLHIDDLFRQEGRVMSKLDARKEGHHEEKAYDSAPGEPV